MPTPTPKRIREAKNSLEGQIVRFAMSGKLAKGGRRAIRSQKKRGLAVTVMQGDRIVKIFPDGRVETLKVLAPTKYTLPAGVQVMRGQP